MQAFPTLPAVRMADYHVLSNAEMPSRSALRAANYTAKFPLFYRGTNPAPDLAGVYTHAHAFGWTDVLERHTMPREIPRLLARMGLYSRMGALFQHQTLSQQYVTFHKLLDAYAFLGVESTDARNVAMHAHGAELIKNLCHINHVRWVGELEISQFALALLLTASLRNVACNTGNLHAFGTNDWHDLARWADTENLMRSPGQSHVRMVSCLYTLQEMLDIYGQIPNFEITMFERMIVLRHHVSSTLDVTQVISYLRMPAALFNDFFNYA